MSLKLGMVMDPIQKIKTYKDSSFAMLLAAQARDWELNYMEMGDIFVHDGRPFARMRQLSITDQTTDYYRFTGETERPLDDLDVIIMRKDPPFDLEYVYATYILELAEQAGTLIVNRPQALRDANEKMFTTQFPKCVPPSLITRSKARLHAFLQTHQDIIIKPLDMMGGSSIFRVQAGSDNVNVIFETMTADETRFTIAQRYLRAVTETGDKRILLIDGEPVPHALARMPQEGETRANMAAGGKGVGRAMTERDEWICAQIGPVLREMGLLFVGIDIIGDYLTEVNVTSPTGIRELDDQFDLDIAGQLMDAIATKVDDGA